MFISVSHSMCMASKLVASLYECVPLKDAAVLCSGSPKVSARPLLSLAFCGIRTLRLPNRL